MKKCVYGLLFFLATAGVVNGQDKEEKEKKGFQADHLFTGGSVSLGFYNKTFLIGANPVFGYNLTDWLDAGIVVNYSYGSARDINNIGYNDKLRQSLYGGGVFTKIYPIRFIFLQAQLEHNFIRQKYFLPGSSEASETAKVDASSFLVGAGYTSDRDPGSGRAFFYFSVLVDLGDDVYSPYLNNMRRPIPIIRGGVQVPLFQKR